MSQVLSDTGAPRASARELGLWLSVALVVGNMIGSGVFLLPAALAPFGANSILGWSVTAAGSIVLALVFAQLSRTVPNSGGPYAYPRAAFGESVGFVVAWGYWVSVWAGNAAIAIGSVSYLGAMAPWLTRRPGVTAIVTIAVVWSVTAVNCAGVRAAAHVQSVTTILKLLPLAAVIGLGVVALGGVGTSHLASVPLSTDGINAAATLTLWSLIGLESATIPADRVREPARTIPRATVIGTLLTAIICAVSCSFVMLLVPGPQLSVSTAPFADAVRPFWGEGSAIVLALMAALSGFGALNGWTLLQGELPFAMAQQGLFPRVFARADRRGTPRFALVFSSVLVTVLVLTNFGRGIVEVFTFVLLLSTCATLFAYLVCSVALLELIRRREIQLTRGRTFALAVLGFVATAYALWAIAGAGPRAVGWGVALLMAGLPILGLMRAGILETVTSEAL